MSQSGQNMSGACLKRIKMVWDTFGMPNGLQNTSIYLHPKRINPNKKGYSDRESVPNLDRATKFTIILQIEKFLQ